MPGRHLSNNESRLLHLWDNPPANLARPQLRKIEIGGGTGLRGIDGLVVPFRYPITAICGNNGVGKSTILGLAALAHHSPKGWHVHLGNTSSHHFGGDRTYYTFSNFFVSGHGEPAANGVSVTWRYFQKGAEHSLTFKKKRSGWGRYVQRPEREVDFLPLGRILPAHESTGIRTTFMKAPRRISSIRNAPLDGDSCKLLSFIMGRKYSEAEVQQSWRYTFQRCHAGVQYTAFNMGAGESCMIALLHLVQRMPSGGLLVIEEIEAGLHSQAQVRLATTLVSISLRKQIQIICSTHSGIFLDSLPRQARLVMKRSVQGHEVVESPSTRFAMYEMTGQVQPELIIYCEDKTAVILVEEALPQNLRLRVTIQDVGSDATVIRQGVSHLRSGFVMKSLCVLDGDCSAGQIDAWNSEERGDRNNLSVDYIILPGDHMPPERWALSQLSHNAYRNAFAGVFACSIPEADAHIQALGVDLNHHDMGFTLHQRTGLDPTDCIRRTMRAFALPHPQLEALRVKVSSLLG